MASMTNVTVLIPARNSEKTLAETLESLVIQTFKDFDVLLVNDASNDLTTEIAYSFQSRLQLSVLNLSQNAGVAGALNQGLAQIDSKYIARIDADDLALPTRLEKQFSFLESNPEIDVCGTWMEMFYDSPGRVSQILAKPESDSEIKTALIQYCSLSHPSVMLRKSFFDDVGNYDIRLDFAEDYDLWCRGALLGKRYANLSEVLTSYRQHDGQVGKSRHQLQFERDLIIKRKYISALLGGESSGNLAEFFSLLCVFVDKEIALNVVEQSISLLLKLARKVTNEKLYSDIVASCIRRHLA